MKHPLFNVGEKVVYSTLGETGVVLESFESDGGFRYYVRIRGCCWSAPEAMLDTIFRKMAPKNNEGLPG